MTSLPPELPESPDAASEGQDAESDFMPFACVAILGVGLMGGSLGLALRKHGLAKHVVGFDKEEAILAYALERGALYTATTDLTEAVRVADCIVAAAPVSVIPALLEQIAPQVRPDALVTDLGSTKARIVEIGTRLFGPRFVGGHPMSGSEESGIQASRPEMFTGAAWAIVRPEPFALETDAPAARLAALISALGARPMPLGADCHDRLVALVSHLPHVLSFTFARTVAEDKAAEQARALAGGSYRDLMRVSAADPLLWRDIFLENRDALLEAIAAYESYLHTLRQQIVSTDAHTLLKELDASRSL